MQASRYGFDRIQSEPFCWNGGISAEQSISLFLSRHRVFSVLTSSPVLEIRLLQGRVLLELVYFHWEVSCQGKGVAVDTHNNSEKREG